MESDMAEFLSKWEQETKERIAKGKATLLAQCEKLEKQGVSFVVMHYDGQGDSGSVESVIATADESYEANGGGGCGNALPVELDETLFCEAADQVADIHRGWENNEGAFGDVVLNVKKRTVTVHHNERFSDSNYSETEL